MKIDQYSQNGKKIGSVDAPASLIDGKVNKALMVEFHLLQQANSRTDHVHVKNRGEVRGSTKKLFMQKHTGNARRGSVRSPLLKGGGKAFGPRNTRNFEISMPRKQRHAAIRSILSYQGSLGGLLALDSYTGDVKTKAAHEFLKQLPVTLGRRIVFVVPEKMPVLESSFRNIEGVRTITASYLNPHDLMTAKHVIFVADALDRADKIFGKHATEVPAAQKDAAPKVKKPKVIAKRKTAATAEKKAPAKKSSKKSA